MRKYFLITVLSFTSLSLWAQSANTPSTINLSGSAQKSVQPDVIVLSIDISGKASSEKEALDKMTIQTNALSKTLKKDGFTEESIKLEGLSINDDYEFENGRNVKKGYKASQQMSLRFPLDKQKLFKVVSDLISQKSEGVNLFYSTECSDELRKKTQKELIASAVKDAYEKASILASASKCKITVPQSINYSNGQVFRPMQASLMRAKSNNRGQKEREDSEIINPELLSIREVQFTEDVSIVYLIVPEN